MTSSIKRSMSSPVDCDACAARVDGLCALYSANILPLPARFRAADKHLAAGEDVLGVGETFDGIYNLVEGWVALYTLLDDGRRQVLHFGLPGAVIGFQPDSSAITTYGVQALTDAAFCFIPRKNLAPLVQECPEIAMRLAWLMSRDRSLSFGHLTSIGRHSARERVSQLLLELFTRYRSQWPGHRIEELRLPLTQELIGDATGLTGVHVNRVLRELKRDGIVEFQYRKLRILDPDKLVQVARIDPHLLAPWIRRHGEGEGMRAGPHTLPARATRVAA
ncbi:Crp/Fnr family transcriptional regulator [Microbaculum marinisediminis]|uniref:Crp/Fnr family transcriptional regulator n=1 Tax=Microbaculum marinisediminis TaxID=2931392 RepID=A0AAW5QUW1_9HYPH|nr:Crp/Fnr family transcriptional regulator [Microbaculum sp. A6E488]MCT8971846.1 Crp/Fnr family transcriptional regulator [Microbaculum sp. A6E488]